MDPDIQTFRRSEKEGDQKICDALASIIDHRLPALRLYVLHPWQELVEWLSAHSPVINRKFLDQYGIGRNRDTGNLRRRFRKPSDMPVFVLFAHCSCFYDDVWHLSTFGKLLNIGGMLEKKADTLLKPYNLNQQQYSILFAIHQQGKVNLTSMVNRLLLEKPHVSKVTKELRRMGLIDVEASEEDKRSFWLSMTTKGVETVRKCQESIQNMKSAVDRRDVAG